MKMTQKFSHFLIASIRPTNGWFLKHLGL